MDGNVITDIIIPAILEKSRTAGILLYHVGKILSLRSAKDEGFPMIKVFQAGFHCSGKVKNFIKKSMDYDSFTINIESFKNACKINFVKTMGYDKEEGYVVKNTKTSW